MSYNIAIDGPSGAGKSTIAKFLAKKLDILYLDTGAMYRGVGYFITKRGIDPKDENAVLSVLDEITMEIIYDNGAQRVIVCGEDVTPFIREHSISMAASTVSKIPAVRLKLVDLQRKIASSADCVLDGRDIGTYVLPNAKYKFFLTADAEERARRRYAELIEKGSDITFEEVLRDVKARDYQDMNRSFAPLKPADDAVIIDSTSMSVAEVAESIVSRL